MTSTSVQIPLPETAARWQLSLRNAIRDPVELASLLEIPVEALGAHASDFPLLVPRGFVARMKKGDPRDPLLLQVLPRNLELQQVAGYSGDPLQEAHFSRAGVLQKYARRALLIATGACPVHCRYCFRRAFPYTEQLAARFDWNEAIDAVRAEPDINEVILSGGDPLSLSNQKLQSLIRQLESTHVDTLRIHTRFPIAIPERVDEGLLALLRSTRLHTVVVVHCNHARELDDFTQTALRVLQQATGQLLNQSVLLKEVNDDADTLVGLSERLFRCGVLPYYLHLLDHVAGAAHFDVPEERGIQLVSQMRSRLPGYLVPRLVREIPGEASKTLIF